MRKFKRVFTTYAALAAAFVDTTRAQRIARRVWKRHVARHGGAPLVLLPETWEAEERRDEKAGRSKPRRPCRVARGLDASG